MLPHILTSQSLTVLLDGRSLAIPRSHVHFDAIVEAITNDDTDEVRRLIDVKQAISNWSRGKIEINDRVLTYAGQEIQGTLTNKIVDFIREGDERLAQPLINFLDKVMENPSRRAVQGLYDWVCASGMPIHEDGDILAWKIVKDDFHDYYSGNFDHSPGNVVEQPRNQCDEDPDVTCSYGLHFCSFAYLPHYGSGGRRIMLVKIHPRDVVAFPRDYNLAKGRCCRLEVVQQVEEPEGFFKTSTVYFEETAKPEFQVGQKWRDDEGDVHTIKEIGDDILTECYGAHYHFDLNGEGSCLDLEDLVEDAPEPEPEFPGAKPGQRWRCRDGEVRKVANYASSSDIVRLDDGSYVFANSGRGNSLPGNERPYDLIELLPEFPELKVGQKWKTRGGAVRTVTEITTFGTAQLDGENSYSVFTSDRLQSRVSETEHDLVEFVEDAKVDWSKPIETVDGDPCHLLEVADRDDKTVAVVSDHPGAWGGNHYDLTTGKHCYGSYPDVRNVA